MMEKYLGFVAVSVFLLSCAEAERNNPYDELAVNYIWKSSAEGSSSSVKAGINEPSSSSAPLSSSNVVPSSSSLAAASSSSSRPPSSSSSFVSQNGVVYGTPVDYEGQTYQTVVIGTQTWMAKNLNYNATGSKCYGGVDSNCNTYGRLYDWSTAMGFGSSCNSNTCSSQVQPNHRGVCPPGWHIPSDAEWSTLETAVGGSYTAGTKLKAKSGWNDYNGASGNGTDDYGFSALPGGSGLSGGYFNFVGDLGNWWSATEGYSSFMRCDDDAYYQGLSDKGYLFSVRCVQD